MQNTRVLLDKIREWDEVASGKRTRNAFLKSPYGKYFSVRSDINPLGGWSYLYPLATGKKPAKLSNFISNDEDFFREYSRLQNIIGVSNRALTRDEIDRNNPRFSSSVIRKRYKGGLRIFHREHLKWEEGLKESITPEGNFTGKAGEFISVGELLLKGYNAQLVSVDEGIDVIAYRGAKVYFFQVKYTSYDRKTDIRRININSFSYKNNLYSNVFYLFILEKLKGRDLIILPAHLIEIIFKNNEKTLGVIFIQKGDDIYINGIKSENKINKYLNQNGWRNLSFS